MGTTQRIIPGVTKEPNWGDLSRSITQIAKTVEDENEANDADEITNQNETNNLDDDNPFITRNLNKISKRRSKHLKKALSTLIKTGGGKKVVLKGKSTSIGKAGYKSSQKLVTFFVRTSEIGLPATLQEFGLGDLTGKSVKDVIDFLLIYTAESSVGMDETAANRATCEVLNDLAEKANNDIEKFETLLKTLINGTGLADLVCKFWGYYIFEHLSQRFEEKISQSKGESISKETFKIIQEDIIGRIVFLNEQRPITKIDWRGNEGKKKIEKIFQSILNIICDEKDN